MNAGNITHDVFAWLDADSNWVSKEVFDKIESIIKPLADERDHYKYCWEELRSITQKNVGLRELATMIDDPSQHCKPCLTCRIKAKELLA